MSTLDDLKKSISDKKGAADPKVANTSATIENIKKETPLLKDLSNALTKYHSLLTALSQTGVVVTNILLKIADCHDGELNDSIKTIVDVHKGLEEGRQKMAEEIMSKVIVPIEVNSKKST